MKSLQSSQLGLVLSAMLMLGTQAPAFQLTYSVNYKGPIISQLATGGGNLPITEADVLTLGPLGADFGPLPPPAVALDGGQLGIALYVVCQGHPAGVACGVEVDSLSQGWDTQATNLAMPAGTRLWFSVDEWAVGEPLLWPEPNILSEGGLVGDSSADIFVEYTLGIGPLPPSAPAGLHVGVFDGNGMPSATPLGNVYPGTGLIEPNLPSPGLPNSGDDIDSLDIGALLGFPTSGYYLSMDSAFLDPLEGVANSGSAALAGFSGADVLLVPAPGAGLTVFAPAALLGLDLSGIPDSDDLDALILSENGNMIFEPSQVPYDWLTGSTDMLLFSVRRGSAVIGSPDSIFGVPIEEGDVLTTPLSPLMGGVSPFPGIFYAAESLGLRTARTHGVAFGDDLNAMDIAAAACFDCNHNGVEDAIDISTGASSDTNNNGIPDECEKIKEYCACPSASAPCGNGDSAAGCSNSTGAGSHLYFMGTNSILADDLVLVADSLPASQPGILYMGANQLAVPFGDGLRCVGAGASGTFRYAVQFSGTGGVVTYGPGLASLSCASFPALGCLTAGSTWNFQFWYRDPIGPCGNAFNLSNGLEVEFVP